MDYRKPRPRPVRRLWPQSKWETVWPGSDQARKRALPISTARKNRG
jgi:hypothetical protein